MVLVMPVPATGGDCSVLVGVRQNGSPGQLFLLLVSDTLSVETVTALFSPSKTDPGCFHSIWALSSMIFPKPRISKEGRGKVVTILWPESALPPCTFAELELISSLSAWL